MNTSKFENLSSQELTLMVQKSEQLIYCHRATLADYDIFVQCQYVLASRKVANKSTGWARILENFSTLN